MNARRRGYIGFDVRDIDVNGEWRAQDGALLMTTSPGTTYEYGDLIEIEGELETPPSFPGFDYREYLLREGVTSLVAFPEVGLVEGGHGRWYREPLFELRREIVDAIGDALPEPEASLASGVLLGARQDIPKDLKEDMQATGTSHLVAVSGQNLAILAGLVIAALAWLIGRRSAAWVALVVLVSYAVLVGVQPSVLRAAIMGLLYVGATIAGRQSVTVIALGYAAALMTALDPQVVHDISFQLSFAATLGLTTLAPRLKEGLDALIGDLPLGRPVSEMSAVTLAAIAFTLPIQAINFGTVSAIAPVANLFAVPAFLAVAATAAIAAFIMVVLPSASTLAAWIAWPPAAYMIGVIQFFAGFPGASMGLGGVQAWHAMIWYAALFAVAFGLGEVQWPERDSRASWIPGRQAISLAGLAAVVAVAVGVSWVALMNGSDGRVSVTVMDVGQGDAILIEDDVGHRVLVDGGPSGSVLSAALGRNLPFYDRRIDLVVLTHPQLDHMGGLIELLDSYDVGAVLVSPAPGETEKYDEWIDALARERVPVTPADRGQLVNLDGGSIEVLSPDAGDPLLGTRDINDASVVLRVAVGGVSFLLTGDLGEEGEAAVARSGVNLESTVLKIGHHGSRFSSTAGFLARVEPVVSLISAGTDNRFGHPTDETLARLAGDAVYRTDEDGDITVSTDGERLWVETQR